MAVAAMSTAQALQVEEGEQCFHELADAVSEPVWLVRHDGKLVYGNRPWHALTSIGEGADFPGDFPSLIHPEDRPQWIAAWQQAVESRRACQIDCRIRDAQGAAYVRRLERAQPVWNATGDVIEWVLIATPYDDRQQLIDELRHSLLHKDAALVAVAHEMRSPLAPIASAMKILERRGSDPLCVADVRALVSRQLAQLVRLVEDLLDFGRLEQRQLSVYKNKIDLRDVVAAAAETTQPIITARAQRLSITMVTDEAVVHADEGRLTQVVVNVLTNAAKFTDDGGCIWLSLEREGLAFLIKVRDTGIGISHKMLPRVFDAYVRSDHGTRGRGSGLGLGLSLARELTQLHGGALTAHSDGVGKGSEFVVRLPAASPL